MTSHIQDPIIIKYIDAKRNYIKCIYVFVSYADKKVIDELNKIEQKFNRNENINSSSVLQKEFGSTWKKKLGLNTKITGGNEFEDTTYDDFDEYHNDEQDDEHNEHHKHNQNHNDEQDDNEQDEHHNHNQNHNNDNEHHDDLDELVHSISIDNYIGGDENLDISDNTIDDNLLDELNIRESNMVDVSLDDLREIDYQIEEKKRQEKKKEELDDDFEDNTNTKNNANTGNNTNNKNNKNDKNSNNTNNKNSNTNNTKNNKNSNNKLTSDDHKHQTRIKFVHGINLYMMDNIIEMKNKIYVTTGIPMYRQHLWYKYNNVNHPMSYSINIDNNIRNIDMEYVIDFYSKKINSDEIENIPVDISYFRNKLYLQVIAEDSFKIIKTYYEDLSIREFYVVDLNDIINTSELYDKLSKDKYQLDIIYYGFIIKYFPIVTYSIWNTYIKNENNIKDLYPFIYPNKEIYKKKLELEKQITELSYYAYNNTDLKKKIYSSIINTNINIQNYKQNYSLLFILRNIFDLLELTDTVVFCKANLLYKNNNIILKKSYHNEPDVKLNIPINSLLIKVKISNDENENIKLILYKNGNYMIKTDWREENKMTFDSIIKIVSEKINPIIKLINKMGPKIKYYDVEIPEVNKLNAIFTNTSVVHYYQSDLSMKNYKLFLEVLLEFNKADIIINKPEVSQYLEYYFNKGMYDFDSKRIEKIINIDNYYGFLSDSVVKQKWMTIFKNTRLLQVFNNINNIKVIINGIKNNTEMNFFNIYLNGIFYMYNEKIKHVKDTSTSVVKSNLTIKNLKIQDPILYDFKKIYNSDVVYSKLCQKQHQPQIISQADYNKLSASEKERTVKYWNFTKKEPTWYNCPNTKYPHVKFITNEHPKKYCIPCCMKVAMSEKVNPIRQNIHNTCLKEHSYEGEKKNITKKSNYIATYGKNIELGRLCRLPELTLEPLFFDTYSDNASIEPECVINMGYYLLGIDQNLKSVSKIGYLFCLVHALGYSVEEFLLNCCEKIKKDPNKFSVLTESNNEFETWQELVGMLSMLNGDALINNKYHKLNWNKLFMSIGYYYYGVNTLLFHDKHKQNINFVLPKGLSSVDAMFPVNHKNLIVLLKNHNYYPIYLVNIEIFKKTGIIDTRLFANDSSIITILTAVLRQHFVTYDNVKTVIDLSVITKFANDNSLIIEAYYINYSNMCYAVLLNSESGKDKNSCYFPIETSHYSLDKNIKLLFEQNYGTDIKNIVSIMNLYNKWIKKESSNINEIIRKQTNSKISNDIIYFPEFKIQNWLNFKNNIIGFTAFNLYFYCNELTTNQALNIANAPVQHLMYNPHEINNIIHDIKKKKNKNESSSIFRKKLNVSLYNYYIYKLLLLHYINIFSKERNVKLRNLIIKTLLTNEKNNDNINKIVESIEDIEDSMKLKNIIVSFINSKHNKTDLIKNISDTKFNFDMIELEALKKMGKKQIFDKLKKLSKSFVKYGDIEKIKNFVFPDILSTCAEKSSNEGYCESSKFIIKESKLNELLLIMTNDITNPDKWKWIFNSIFIEKNTNYFKFIRRPNESIFIEYN